MNVAFTVTQQQKMRPMNCHFRAYEVCTNFGRGLLHTGRRTGVEPLNLVIIHIMHHSLSDIFEMCGGRKVSFGICIIMKALNGIQKQMTLKVHNV